MPAGITAQYGFPYQQYIFIKLALDNAGMDRFFVCEGIVDIEIVEEAGAWHNNISINKWIQLKVH